MSDRGGILIVSLEVGSSPEVKDYRESAQVWEDCRILTLAELPHVALDLLAAVVLSLNCWHCRVSASCATMNSSRLALRLCSSNMSFSRIMLELMDMLVVVKSWLNILIVKHRVLPSAWGHDYGHVMLLPPLDQHPHIKGWQIGQSWRFSLVPSLD